MTILPFKVKKGLVFLDILCWLISIVIMFSWRLITVKGDIFHYVLEYVSIGLLTIILGSLLGKYRSLRRTRFVYTVSSMIATWVFVCLFIWVASLIFNLSLSLRVTYFGVYIVIIFNIVYLLGFYYWRYAQYMEEDSNFTQASDREYSAQVSEPHCDRTLSEQESITQTIQEYTNKDILCLLQGWTKLISRNTKVVANEDSFSIKKIAAYRYDTIVNLKLLNDIRGVNVHFCMVNEKLPDNGEFICCFRPQRFVKERIMKRYPRVINKFIYILFFFCHRLMPKLFASSRLYFDITNGRNRVFSQTEILGRLAYCGFDIVEEATVGHIIYVKARRASNPHTQSRARRYGPLIKLSRVGKNGKKFNVYKMRTMHPYSEFLQKYIFEKNNLAEGGKIKNDIRVSTIGAFMRKYWLDELPMFINFFKGDMKFVGVRPLSSHYFSLYSSELQAKRIKHKPGLFPPFYADMPKTLEEIQKSEMNYLTLCEQKGTFITDMYYMWKIFVNIVFKKARSK